MASQVFPLALMGAFHPSMGHCASEDQEITVNRCEELPKCSALLLQRKRRRRGRRPCSPACSRSPHLTAHEHSGMSFSVNLSFAILFKHSWKKQRGKSNTRACPEILLLAPSVTPPVAGELPQSPSCLQQAALLLYS